jgi:hypothetical protein
MSINRSQELQSGDSSVFNDYRVSEGSSNSTSQDAYARRQEEGFNDLDNYNTYSWNKPYTIPLKSVKNRMSTVVQDITELLSTYEQNLKNVYLNPYLDPGLEDSHFHIWDELSSNNKSLVEEYFPASTQSTQGEMTTAVEEVDETDAGDDTVIDVSFGLYTPPTDPDNNTTSLVYPQYVSFSQYLYAEKHGCRGCRKFVKDYDRLISHSVFVHLFDFRYFLKLLLHEANNIKNSLTYDFGDTYEDESQQQAASFYFSWAEMAAHYTKVIAEQLSQGQDYLSSSEVDYISKKQAAQFQAFFSIRVASYTEGIDNVLFSLKKELMDNSEIFYERYVSPSLKFKLNVSAPLELDIQTTNLKNEAPVLASEIITAVNALKGNFGSILSDMVQRRSNLRSKFDRLVSLNLQRKKYISYIDQLSTKASTRPRILIEVKEDNTSTIFDRVIIDENKNQSLKSSHGLLDDLSDNSHPQYLLRSGGSIFGNIEVQDKVTIDGVDISAHAHTGEDGSIRIKSTDIDYETPREDTELLELSSIGEMQVTVESFVPDIRTGGMPVVDVVLNIEIPDEIDGRYEYEIAYLEI